MKAFRLAAFLFIWVFFAQSSPADSVISVNTARTYVVVGNMLVDTVYASNPSDTGLSGSLKSGHDSAEDSSAPSAATDTVGSVPRKSGTRISSDSAKIISPQPLTILDSDETVYEITPLCPVDSVVLFVHYYPSRIDTLAVLTEPPFRATWNYQHIPDQDQTQLQFGYTLFHTDGFRIESPPLPHRWVIDRTGDKKHSPQSYVCHELPVYDSIRVDGHFDDWPRAKAMHIGADARIRYTWTSAHFFAAITVEDPDITPGDRVELMFDMFRQREPFAGIEQRIISFGPRRRRFTWAVRLSDSASVQVDSILVRTGNEMEWKARETEKGYSIEAKIPFVILADVEFPPPEFGFDAAVVDVSSLSGKKGQTHVDSWTGTHPASRHNPGRWGTIKLKQVWLPLKATLSVLVVVALTILAGILWLMFHKIRTDKAEMIKAQKSISPLGTKFLAFMEADHAHCSMDIAAIAKELNVEPSALRASIEKDFDSDADSFLTARKIKLARILLRDSEDQLDSIARTCGFQKGEEFTQTFLQLVGVTPEKYRENKLADRVEEEEEEEEEA